MPYNISHYTIDQEVILSNPAGTGYSGGMRVPRQTIDLMESKGIEVHVALTRDAVSLYQKLQGKKNTIAALHLTC